MEVVGAVFQPKTMLSGWKTDMQEKLSGRGQLFSMREKVMVKPGVGRLVVDKTMSSRLCTIVGLENDPVTKEAALAPCSRIKINIE